MKRPRKVFGRIRADGGALIVEMRRDGLWLRRKHQRKGKAAHVTFHQLIDAANGQMKLL